MPQSFRSGLRLHSEQNPQAVDFSGARFYRPSNRLSHRESGRSQPGSASHDSVVNALPLEVPHPPDSKQHKINYSEGRLPPTNTADARWERSASLLALSINFEGDLGDTSMRAIAYA